MVGPAKIEVQRYRARTAVAQYLGDPHRLDAAMTPFVDALLRFHKGVDAADAGADDAADFVHIVVCDRQAAIRHRLPAGFQRELGDAIQPARFLAPEDGVGVEVLDFAGQLVLRQLAVITRDEINAVLAGRGIRPSLRHSVAGRAQNAHAGDRDSFAVQSALQNPGAKPRHSPIIVTPRAPIGCFTAAAMPPIIRAPLSHECGLGAVAIHSAGN